MAGSSPAMRLQGSPRTAIFGGRDDEAIGKRLLTVIPSLIGVVIVTFLLTRVLPGDTAAYFAGPAASAQAIEEIRKQLGLDKPLPEQFVRYVVDLAHGDFGKSLTTGQPVLEDIASRLPASAELTLAGLIVAMLIAVPLGILAAREAGLAHRSRLPDRRDRGRVAAGVLHRPAADLRLLFQARLGAGAARAARRLLFDAADDHRLLSDRQPARRRLRGVPRRIGAAHPADRDARASSRSRRSRA